MLANLGVAHIRQVRNLRAHANFRVFGLDERADLAVSAKISAGAQVSVRANVGTFTDVRRGDVRFNHGCSRTNLRVNQNHFWPNARAFGNRGHAVQHGARQQCYVLAKRNRHVDPRRGRVDNRYAGEHPRFTNAPVEFGANFGQLNAVVHTSNLPVVFNRERLHLVTGSQGNRGNVGQVLFALRICCTNLGQSRTQNARVENINTGIDFSDFKLSFGGIFVLNDALKFVIGGANDATVSGWVFGDAREHRHRVSAINVGFDKRFESRNLEQWHVTAGNHDGAVEIARQSIQAAFDSATGAGLVILIDAGGT
ncbi:unannotated protein [freshwater metagenome]|uniref:Unannotated protein n=1 Tax=freshwater metagenome TaxID=449393 RepID=A0A6J6C1C8_9ZZZZ